MAKRLAAALSLVRLSLSACGGQNTPEQGTKMEEDSSDTLQGIYETLNGCFEDWDANRGSFDDAGVADTMEALMENGTAQWS